MSGNGLRLLWHLSAGLLALIAVPAVAATAQPRCGIATYNNTLGHVSTYGLQARPCHPRSRATRCHCTWLNFESVTNHCNKERLCCAPVLLFAKGGVHSRARACVWGVWLLPRRWCACQCCA